MTRTVEEAGDERRRGRAAAAAAGHGGVTTGRPPQAPAAQHEGGAVGDGGGEGTGLGQQVLGNARGWVRGGVGAEGGRRLAEGSGGEVDMPPSWPGTPTRSYPVLPGPTWYY